MIPKRVRLGGFLCYKDEQEVRFDGSSLWMLAGLNGSGKSSIFDAVTYALFNSHRGGSSSAVDLINKDAKSLTVEFDFELQKTLYQIRRTYRRDNKGGGSGTQQISEYRPAEGGGGSWAAVPDTSLAAGFKKWVDEHVGLTYDIFTSSVLLRQGHAEKLLDAKPGERAKVLSGIVDMDRFIGLHVKADESRKKAKAEQEATAGQLQGVPEVVEIEWVAAENRIAEAEDTVREAEAAVEQLKELEYTAMKWADLRKKQAELQAKSAKFQATLADADKIEKAYLRLRELKEVIPHVLTVQAKQRAMEESVARAKKLADDLEMAEARAAKLDADADAVRKKRKLLQDKVVKTEAESAKLIDELRELTGHLAQVRVYEQQTARLEQFQKEIDQLPRVTRDQADALEAKADALQRLALGIPLVESFAKQRTHLHESVTRRAEVAAAQKVTTEKGLKTRKAHDDAKRKLDEATEFRAKADDEATAARTRQQDAKKGVDEFTQLDGAKLCRACGQPLTAAHFHLEQDKRKAELKAAVAVFRAASDAQAEAKAAEQEAKAAHATLLDELQKLRDHLSEANTELKTLDKTVEQQTEACRSAYATLPDTQRKLVSPTPPDDWTATVWPTADDLKALKREAGEAESAKTQLAQARTNLARLDKLHGDIDSTRQQIEQVKQTLPPGDPTKLRQRETSLKADESGAQSVLAGAKADIKKGELELDRLAKETTANQAGLADIKAKRAAEESSQSGFHDAIERAVNQIPEAWRAQAQKAGFAEQSRWKGEHDQLVTDRIEAKYDDLAKVRAERDNLKQDIDTVTAQADAIPEEARRAPDDVRKELAAAKQTAKSKAGDLQEAREHRAILDRHRDQRRFLAENLKAKDQELKGSKLLAELLGKDRLQLHLLRTAEKQIVSHANAILDRLSGGQLFMKLAPGKDGAGADTALDLEAYNRQTGGAPINVTFLSGSQRFRIAVSLALAIGQYASKQHRPIESVIIDEGFGCLDRNGRQVMIQELQNLRGHLECILLVSHQEEFAEAFPDGYKFALEDGSARVTRFQQ